MIYLDNSATTKVCEEAAKKAFDMMTVQFGNPSSLHGAGDDAAKEISFARQAIAKALHCKADEIVFTSGGSESNNTAIFGASSLLGKRGNRIVTTDCEHPSVAEPIKVLEQRGFEIIRLSTKGGKIDSKELVEAINSKTILVSMMLVNNETGAVFPVREAAMAIKRAKAPALLHCDAVQAFMKLDIMPQIMGIDLLSVSAHKVHAPKGIGALYIRNGVHLPPLIYGGGQESGMRSGTENAASIAAFACAVEHQLPNMKTNSQIRQKLYAHLEKLITEKLPFAKINKPANAVDCIMSLTLDGYNAETVVHYLAQKDICISAGSACKKGARSYVLEAFGLDEGKSRETVRISLCADNTEQELETLVNELSDMKIQRNK
ncbi:MAG: cysteine desulfurase [Ruminococcaceae bacterium]|nr:cysteine desulfurase [Oscillospiraceae bacterium]